MLTRRMLSVTAPLDQRLDSMGEEIRLIRASAEWATIPEGARILLSAIEISLCDAVDEVLELKREPSRREMEAGANHGHP